MALIEVIQSHPRAGPRNRQDKNGLGAEQRHTCKGPPTFSCVEAQADKSDEGDKRECQDRKSAKRSVRFGPGPQAQRKDLQSGSCRSEQSRRCRPFGKSGRIVGRKVRRCNRRSTTQQVKTR